MPESQLYSVSVVLTADRDNATLLSLASTLHRRGVFVVEAGLSRPSSGSRMFSATIDGTERQAATVRSSLQNHVDVLDAVVLEATDARHQPADGTWVTRTAS